MIKKIRIDEAGVKAKSKHEIYLLLAPQAACTYPQCLTLTSSSFNNCLLEKRKYLLTKFNPV